MDNIPFVVLGDGPTTPSGLGRIATDLCRHLWADRETLGIDLLQVGWPHVDADSPTFGSLIDHPDCPWPLWGFRYLGDWGLSSLQTAYAATFGDRPGILFTVWDPSRCLTLVDPKLPVETWGYFAVDAMNVNGGISGPAGDVVEGYDRVLAYTRFGAAVLGTRRAGTVESLPHGIDTDVFTPERTPEQEARTTQLLGGYVLPETLVVGCVATNMRRKDFGIYFQTLQILREVYRIPVHGWIHTNREVSDAWSLPQLALDTNVGTALTVTLALTDEELAGLYTRCAFTIAPGLGEGFGYPIIESRACGTPVLHGDYGGGAELTPMGWRIKPVLYRLEGPYALQRPVFDANSWAQKAVGLATTALDREAIRVPVRDMYDWRALWPNWRRWVQQGLRGWREQR